MKIGTILRELLFPSRAVCAICGDMAGDAEKWVCQACRDQLKENACCGFVAPADSGMMRCAAAHRYAGSAAGSVRALKYAGYFALAPEMADEMKWAADAAGLAAPDVVCPVPMHFLRRLKRGFNHAELLAKHVAEGMGIEMKPVLKRVRRTPQQARLSESQRRRNLRGVFRAGDVKGLRVLLIDDVYTTGATAAECADALRRAGAARVEFLCYAKTELQ